MTKRNPENKSRIYFDIALAVGTVLLLHTFFALCTGKHIFGENHYNSYVIQAQSWLSGRLDVDYRSWLELAEYGGKYFVSFPPFPSYILLPFTLFFGVNSDSLAAAISLIIGIIFAVKICNRLSLTGFKAVALTVFYFAATNMWQITVDAWVWFIAQNFSITLTLAALYFALKKHKGLSVFLLACAVGCRPFQLIYIIPILYILIKQSEGSALKRIKGFILEKTYVFLPALIVGMSYMVLNYLRFGSVLEFGHNYLPEFTGAKQFGLEYVLTNFVSLFRLPEISAGGIITFPKFDGVNIFLVIPLFVLYPILGIYNCLKPKEKQNYALHIIGVICIIFHIFLLLTHKTMGGYHFGNRYIMDTTPMLFLLTAMLAAKLRNKDALYIPVGILTLLGLVINFYGTYICYISRM